MGAHTKFRVKPKTVWVRGLLISEFPQHLEIRFTPLAVAWPQVLKRIRNAGLSVSANVDRRPILRVDTNLEKLINLLQPRAKRGGSRVALTIAIVGGSAFIFTGLLLPTLPVEPQSKVRAEPENSCSSANLSKAISGDFDNPEIDFQESNSFGGVTAGIIKCSGVRYSYTLESKGDERVLKVQKLDT